MASRHYQDTTTTWKALFKKACKQNRLSKFVPASGAASRMFLNLEKLLQQRPHLTKEKFSELIRSNDELAKGCQTVLENANRIAFMDDRGQELWQGGQYGELLEHLLSQKGLDLGAQGKLLLPVHRYGGTTRTPFEEQLRSFEKLLNATHGSVKIHFSIAKVLEAEKEEKLEPLVEQVANDIKATFDVSYSVQSAASDTISLNHEGELMREENGLLHLRPSGHGALLENLNDYQGDVVLIENVDNVCLQPVYDKNMQAYRTLIGKYLQIEQELHQHLDQLQANKNLDESLIQTIVRWTQTNFYIQPSHSWQQRTPGEKRQWLFDKLDRPLRVCGMVKKDADIGGGPFWLEDKDTDWSPIQIIEMHDVDDQDQQQKKILEASTHFNPVIIICGLKDFGGKKFELTHFAQQNSLGVTKKSYMGQTLSALELPGLWNGSMAKWLSVFVEVPAQLFNPLKTAQDLLRPNHQGK